MLKQSVKRSLSALAITFLGSTFGCADEGVGDGEALDHVPQALVRGRVTDVYGAPLTDMSVDIDGVSARTDARGSFSVMAKVSREARLLVRHDDFSSAELAVSVVEQGGAQIEVAVKRRSTLMLTDAARGGRLEGSDGAVIDLPSDALRDAAGATVHGEVEVRYAMITHPRDITAAPGRMRASATRALEGYGMAEVSFYQAGRRLQLTRQMQVELPLYEGHGLADDQELDLYQMTTRDLHWQPGARARVRGNRVILTGSEDAWLGAATALPETSCVKGKLAAGGRPIANTTVRAARGRGLSLIQAETAEDGSFCMPVTADDDWSVSTYFDDGAARYALAVALRSDRAAGMCGGSTGCKDVGSVSLSTLP